MKFNNILKAFQILPLVALIWSCSDGIDLPGGIENVVYGEPATISIDLHSPAMDITTRSDVDSDIESKISTVWIGFFDSRTGKLVRKQTFTANSSPNHNQLSALEGIDMVSGLFKIGAVANYEGKNGVIRTDEKKIQTPKNLLSILTNDIENYDDFCGLAFRRGSGTVGGLDTPTDPMLMQGVFIPTGNTCSETSDDFAALADGDVRVNPGEYKLDGVLHFRRLLSHQKFEIKYDHNNIRNFQILQARVYNVPATAWVKERKDADSFCNSGDHSDIIGLASPGASSAPVQQNYLRSTTIYPSQIQEIDNTFRFDWWQLENRRKSTYPGCNAYEDRESENKNGDGSNNGVYTALCGINPTTIPADNCATYVQFTVRMELSDSYNFGDAMQGADIISADAQMTTAEVTYTVHLGYCEGSDTMTKSKDFNCRRNTQYTYTVTVNGVNSIIVEARKQTDKVYENGAEGTVTFVTDNYYECDAHYQVFNIALTDYERSTANWQMRVYDDMDRYSDITLKPEDGDERTVWDKGGFPEWKYNWVEFIPTSDMNTLASYNKNNPQYFTAVQLNDMTKGMLGGRTANTNDNTTQHYYTVFINEYVYEKSPGEGTASWREYVNLPARTFWIKVREYRSSDHESVIINSKYAFRQKSIQTYYDASDPNLTAAIGIEQANELSNTPLKYDYPSNFNSGHDGLYLNWQYLTQLSKSPMWKDALNPNTPMPADGDITTANGKPQIGLPNPNNAGKFTAYHEGYSADHPSSYSYSEYEYSVISALSCLNRNRDLDGDGNIDQNELRWFVPTARQYVAMALGASGLIVPLIDTKTLDAASTLEEKNYNAKSKLHMASIDNSQLWTEEGVSTAWLQGCSNPQQVRCIRYLGSDMDVTENISQTTPAALQLAYNILDGHPDVIEFNLVGESMRSDKTMSSMPVHKTTDNFNRPYSYMQVQPIGEIDNNDRNSFQRRATEDNVTNYTECSKKGNGWRMPNQVEIAAMNYLGFCPSLWTGAIDEKGVYIYSKNYLSCTREYANTGRMAGIDTGNIAALSTNKLCWIRCVRDVDLTDL